MNIRQFLNNKIICILIPIFVGVFSFTIIYGIIPLDVTNDSWILSGYDEVDVIQHYAGWLAFRNSDWSFPIGLAKEMAVGTGTIISFTDSIPIVAIFFKLIEKLLPETFQYFGIYTLFCYVLQSIAAFKIIRYKTHNTVYSTIGTVLFAFSPILMERAFRHTALGSHWLILFSIYLYLKHYDEKTKNTYILFGILEILTIGIHPYFLPMVACFALLCTIIDLREKRYISIVFLLLIQVITYLFGCLIGVLGSSVSSSRWGYGFFSMNINAPINPTSCGGYNWSAILNERPQILGNYDGFNYLGMGIIFFMFIITVLLFVLKKQKFIIEKIEKHVFLIMICIFLTLFSLSNIVTLDEEILFTIPFPEFLIELCGIFRASSRMFYPVYYLIFLFLIIFLFYILKEHVKVLHIILLSIVFLQLYDLNNCIEEKHQSMIEKSTYTCYVDDETLRQIALCSEGVLKDEFVGNLNLIAVWAHKNDLQTYFSVANSGVYDSTDQLSDDIVANARESGNLEGNVIVTTNPEILNIYKQFENLKVYLSEGIYFIYD